MVMMKAPQFLPQLTVDSHQYPEVPGSRMVHGNVTHEPGFLSSATLMIDTLRAANARPPKLAKVLAESTFMQAEEGADLEEK